MRRDMPRKRRESEAKGGKPRLIETRGVNHQIRGTVRCSFTESHLKACAWATRATQAQGVAVYNQDKYYYLPMCDNSLFTRIALVDWVHHVGPR